MGRAYMRGRGAGGYKRYKKSFLNELMRNKLRLTKSIMKMV